MRRERCNKRDKSVREESKNGQLEKKQGKADMKRDEKRKRRKDRNLMTSLEVLLPGYR